MWGQDMSFKLYMWALCGCWLKLISITLGQKMTKKAQKNPVKYMALEKAIIYTIS